MATRNSGSPKSIPPAFPNSFWEDSLRHCAENCLLSFALAYTAAAEHLDQSRFVRWLRFPDGSKTLGLLFNTPRGPMAILWDRSDGYILTEKVENFASPEPWTDTWKSRQSVTLPLNGSAATVLNVIGQETVVPGTGGNVELTLTGAPVLVYGLDADRLK